MATRDKLLSLLQDHPGEFLSGEDIAKQLGISRAAVCKAAKALRDQGIPLEAATRKGYRLGEKTDFLSEERIMELLPEGGFQIQCYERLSSTNSFLRDLAIQGAPEGTVVLADTQTAGRGRMGRQFYSPKGTGLYLSLLLRPKDLNPRDSLQITTMAASALCLAIEKVTGRQPGIKWINDLYLEGKKICGILTEASLSMETGSLEYAVLGLGLNLYEPENGFPEDLKEIAGVLCAAPEKDLKNRLTAEFLREFSYFYQEKHFAQAAREYRSRSILTGKTVLADGKQAKVLDITQRCQLELQYEDGTTGTLSYGEVHIVNQI